MSKKKIVPNLLSRLNFPIKEAPETSFLCRYAHINDTIEDYYVVTTFTPHGPIQVQLYPQWLGGPMTPEMDIEKQTEKQFDEHQNAMFGHCSKLARAIAVAPWVTDFLAKIANKDVTDLQAIQDEAESLLMCQSIMKDDGWNEILPDPVQMPQQGTES